MCFLFICCSCHRRQRINCWGLVCTWILSILSCMILSKWVNNLMCYLHFDFVIKPDKNVENLYSPRWLTSRREATVCIGSVNCLIPCTIRVQLSFRITSQSFVSIATGWSFGDCIDSRYFFYKLILSWKKKSKANVGLWVTSDHLQNLYLVIFN